ncbi:MAG: flagellar biosynthesis/type III secretory pathway chaperone [Alphaproteobacteria bacterium]|jgi:flagellar biosynthesis/type III secretory pathway chaperone
MSHAIELVSNTIESCEKFATLLHDENALLKDRDMDAIEGKIKEKRHLAAKVEKLLSTIKTSVHKIKADEGALAKMPELQACIDNYQSAARKNITLLQAAYTVTNDFLNLVRTAVEIKKPKANTYGKTGTMNQHQPSTKLVNKDI